MCQRSEICGVCHFQNNNRCFRQRTWNSCIPHLQRKASTKQPLNHSAHCYLHAASAEHRSLVENFPGESFDVNKMFAKKRLSRSRPAMYQNRAGLVVIWVIGIQKQQRSENFRQCQLHGCQRICIWPRCLRLMRPGACSRSPAAARSCGQCCIVNVHIPKKTCR
jgi:hypothetical protein